MHYNVPDDRYSQVSLEGIAIHPQVSTVGIVQSRADFTRAQGLQNLSGTIWQRPALAPNYQDVFNNVSGIRGILNRRTWDHLMYARISADGSDTIEYRYSEEAGNGLVNLNDSDLLEFFLSAPDIHKDIEFAVRNLQSKAAQDVVVHFLNETPIARDGKTSHITYQFHTDRKDTYYIQIGGAGLEFTNAIPQYRTKSTFEAECGEDDPTTIHVADQHDERMVSHHQLGILNAGDLMHFHGWNTGNALVHRAPTDHAVSREGRLAISIYPT